MNSDTNTSRVAFIEGGEAGLPDGSTLVGFQVKGEHVDSSDRAGVMSGVVVLTASEADKLRGLLTTRPEEFFDFVTRVNGEPLYTNDRKPIGIVRGNGLSVYDSAGYEHIESITFPSNQPASARVVGGGAVPPAVNT